MHIVDDDASFRTAMERRLKHAGYEVATYASAQHLLDRLPSESVPGCILLDVRIPELSGPELQERLSELGSTLPIIFLTGHPDVPTTVRAIKAGADDFLTKPVSSDELLQAVERAIAHHEVTRGLKSKLDMVRAHIAALTPRERQVFELIIRGNTNKQVARALGGTERTIKAHRHRVMEKMQVQSWLNSFPLPNGLALCRRRTLAYLSNSLMPLWSNGTIGNSCGRQRIGARDFDGTNLPRVDWMRSVFSGPSRFVGGQVRDVVHAKSKPRFSGR